MCGLFGFAIANVASVNHDLVIKARHCLELLNHRGPDATNDYIHGGVYLGHTRLAILDLSAAGAQPMVADDAMTAVSVNGEIYNFKDIREQLGTHRFRSQSDSEVVLHGYQTLGLSRLLSAMDGMYAGVVYDHRNQQLHLFRDRVGIKPLFVGHTHIEGQPTLVWASELEPIRRFISKLTIDPSAIIDFAAQRYIPAPKTIYKQVQKLLPAHHATFDLQSGHYASQRYWQIATSISQGSDATLARSVRDAIDTSVAEQLVADVPVSAFLSGGIDSSIISQAAAQNTKDLRTYTIGFDVPSHDESAYAQKVATLLNTNHNCKVLAARDQTDVMEQMKDWYGEPFGDLSALPTAHLCAAAREDTVVALSGDGGDELFGGYRWYERYQSFRRLNRWLATLKPIDLTYYRPPENTLQKLANRLALFCQFDPVQLYTAINSNLLSMEWKEVRQWLEIPDDYDPLWALRAHYRPELGPRRSLQYLDFHTWLPDDILTKVDRVSMAVSLEVRVPFLSKAVCELAFSLPESFLYKNQQLKGGLKYAYKDLLPAEILHRPKRGFSIPSHWWKDALLEGHPGYVHYTLDHIRKNGLVSAV